MKNKFRVITSFWFTACLILLLLNDLVLKGTYHNWITGKLSDFAGLFVFPLFWTALFPKQKRTIFWLTGGCFVYWKSPDSQPLIDAWNELGVLRLARVVDYWDCLALVVLPVAAGYEKRPHPSTCLRLYPQVSLVVAAIAFLATSSAKHHNESGQDEPAATAFTFSAVYQVAHLSRDGLVRQLNRSGLGVKYLDYPNAGYGDQYASVYLLNDRIHHVVFTIGDFDPQTRTVQVKLEEIVCGNDSTSAGDYEAIRDTSAHKQQLKELFESQVLKRISKTGPGQ